ncbi:MAG TPA: hypothetical protein VGN47_15865, partial [Blastococcus sp.]|nr:hypothetical protein [Blastococcus sp.]
VFFGAALATAAPAAAVDDQSRPEARVVKGPSCSPGGMVIDVVARSTPYRVVLATTRTPSGEDRATVAPGATVRLRSRDVAWGETIDSRLEYTALDGSGTTFVDELTDWTFTRPSEHDCAAIAAPPSSAPAAPSSSAAAGDSTGPTGTTAPQAPAPTGSPAPPTPSQPQSQSTVVPAWNTGHATVQAVAAGGSFTLGGSGFQPGERVTVHLHGSDAVLGSATAGPDGSVRTQIRIPAGTAGRSASVDLVGDRSQVTAGVRLALAAEERPVDPGGAGALWALIAAAVALVGTAAALVSVAGSRRR